METRVIFFALGDPTRFKIMETLAKEGPMVAHEIAKLFEITRGATSQHLKILKDADLVASEPFERFQIYRINTKGLEQVEDWNLTTRRLWALSRNNEVIKPDELMNRTLRRLRPKRGPTG